MRYKYLLNNVEKDILKTKDESSEKYHIINKELYDICTEYTLLYDKSKDLRKNFRKLIYFTHPFEGLNIILTSDLLPENNKFKITNAFMKMIEFLWNIDLKITDELTMFDIAGAPGMFIIATNLWCKNNNIKLDWQTCSLENETSLKDTYSLFKNNPERYIKCNILKKEDVERVFNKVGKNKFHLVTGDVGTVHDDDFNDPQEFSHINLQYSQAIMALNLVQKGGIVFLKMYTICTKETSYIIDLLTKYFEKTYICKPFTSRLLNDESYIIGLNRNELNCDNIPMNRILIDKYESINKNIYEQFETIRQSEKIKISNFIMPILLSYPRISFYELLSKNVKYKEFFNTIKSIYNKLEIIN